MDDSSTLPSTIAPIVSHITECLVRHRTAFAAKHLAPSSASEHVHAGSGSSGSTGRKDQSSLPHAPPLFVAFQGPQGAGKTFFTALVRKILGMLPYGIRAAVLSIDDLYRTHTELKAFATVRHPGNALLRGRGLPGTHDVQLGMEVLTRLRGINEGLAESESPLTDRYAYAQAGAEAELGVEFHLPVYDKSLHGGLGDRMTSGSARSEASPEGAIVCAPLDVLLFEGWCVGFCPISSSVLSSRLALAREGKIPDLQDGLDWGSIKEEDVRTVNEYLRDYVEMWEMFDAFVQIKPPDATPYSPIYKWRLEQEHYMKAHNGGRGMDDSQVKTFVDRYIPGYVFFGDGIERGYVDENGVQHRPQWLGQGLKIEIDERRELVRSEPF